MAVIVHLEVFVMAVRNIPFTNYQILAFPSILIATTWFVESFRDRTTRFASQALKVYTGFRELPLSPRYHDSGKQKAGYKWAHLVSSAN